MADSKLTALTALAAATSDDIIYAVNDPGGTPASRKITVAALTATPTDGWMTAADTWVYASASTFTIAGADRTSIYTAGTKLRFKQGAGYKYALVASSAFSTDTTVTIIVNTDYTVANAAITDAGYSYVSSPQGFPQWFAYTPALVNFTIGTGGAAALAGRYTVIGKTVFGTVSATLGSSGQSVGAGTFSLPVTASSSVPTNAIIATGFYKDTGTANYHGQAWLDSTTTALLLYLQNSAGVSYAGIGASAPMVWAAGDSFTMNFSYEMA